jgi:hypothetical protein
VSLQAHPRLFVAASGAALAGSEEVPAKLHYLRSGTLRVLCRAFLVADRGRCSSEQQLDLV